MTSEVVQPKRGTSTGGPAEDGLLIPLMLLTFVTGLVDAASVLGLGRVFAANMTGNIVFLGFALAGAREVSIAGSLAALAGFLVGATSGGRLVASGARERLAVVLVLEVTLLVAAAAWAALTGAGNDLTRGATLVLLAMPMGLQNASMRRLAVPDMTTTVLTLTITGLAADSALAGGTHPRRVRRFGAVAVMLLGAFVGASLLTHGLRWIIGSAAVVTAVALACVLRVGVRSRGLASSSVASSRARR